MAFIWFVIKGDPAETGTGALPERGESLRAPAVKIYKIMFCGFCKCEAYAGHHQKKTGPTGPEIDHRGL